MTRPTRKSVMDALKAAMPGLRAQYGIRSLALFGSVARDQAHADSDIDLLVSFDRPVGLITLGTIEHELATRLRHPVDLVERDALHPALRDAILREAQDAA